jgi:hypothetical protein
MENLVVTAPAQVFVLDVHAGDALGVHSIELEENITGSLGGDRGVKHVHAAKLAF